MTAHLLEHGFAVVRALTDDECDEVVDGFFDWVERVSPAVRRDDPSTFGDKSGWPVSVPATGILPFHGIGQAPFMWKLRTKSSVRRAFASIWGCPTDELLTSFDGAIAFRHWSGDDGDDGEMLARRTRGPWWHVDQHPGKHTEFDCVQGLVNVGPPTTEATGGNVLIPGSRLAFSK